MKPTALLLAVSLSLFAVACGGDNKAAAPTATSVVSDGPPAATASPGARPGTPPRNGGPSTPVNNGGPNTPVPQGSTASLAFAASPDPATVPALLADVRVGEHEGFDRIVFEFKDGQRPSGIVGYKDSVVQCGSGAPVDPAGSHILAVHFDFTNAHTEAGQLSIPSNTVTGPGNSIIESESTCDFEAVVEWAIGVDGLKPFTVTLLENPNRIVIDVAH